MKRIIIIEDIKTCPYCFKEPVQLKRVVDTEYGDYEVYICPACDLESHE